MSTSLSIPADFTPGSANALALQEKLRPKLLEFGYASEDMVGNFGEFITIMIGNAKNKEQINTELSELIGEDFNPSFTDWLFNEVEELAYGSRNGQEMQDQSMDEAIPTESSSVTSPSRRNLRGAPTSARSAAAPYPQTSRVVDQINRALERPPIKHSIPDLPNVPTGPRAQSSAGPIRRGGRGGSRAPVVQPHMPPNFGAFMMANGMPPEMVQQMMADTANFPNQMFPGFGGMNLADRIENHSMDGSAGIVVAGGSKTRCRHWPRCQLPTCKFHHPSQICLAYPNCPNVAGSCPNIHVGEDFPVTEFNSLKSQHPGNGRATNGHKNPMANGHAAKQENRRAKPKATKPQEQVPLCKFGAGCTKPDCPFAHPTPAAGLEGLVLRGEMCPEGRNCLNKECDMGHPSPAVEGVKRKETENCKFFPNCTNPDCPYKHPAVSVQDALNIPCKFGVNCTRPNCVFKHEIAIPCRYNPCLNEQCLFKHADGQQPSKNKVWIPEGNGAAGSLAERKFAYENADENIVVGSGMDGQMDTVVHE